jgi:hypothetical protein
VRRTKDRADDSTLCTEDGILALRKMGPSEGTLILSVAWYGGALEFRPPNPFLL